MDSERLHPDLPTSPSASRAPVLFLGHGSPMNIVRNNSFTRSLRELGDRVEKPAAALVVSAHWLTRDETRVAVNPTPETIHDFGSFPRELYQKTYPAPGAPAQAAAAAEAIHSIRVHPDHEMGLDHGAWSVLLHMWPRADVPVFQLSIDFCKPPAWHFALGRELAALRERGILILASGNIVHNLSRLRTEEESTNLFDWAVEFDAWSRDRLAGGDHEALVRYADLGQTARLAVPTNDHYLPLLYACGALGRDEPVRFTHEGFQHGSISMRCFASGS